MPPPSQPFVTVLMVVGTAMTQLFVQFLLVRLTEVLTGMRLAEYRMAYSDLIQRAGRAP